MSGGITGAVLNWLHEGYPQGIPPKDYHPVLALLRRTVPEPEYEQIAAQLSQETSVDESEPQETAEGDIRQVAARLALAGWPLGAPHEETEPDHQGLLSRVIAWLRAGYPQGVPATDYVPLLALLRRKLSDVEASGIAAELISEGETLPDGTRQPISRLDAQVRIAKVLQDLPTDLDLERVRERLAHHGWPLDD
ncbi:DUF3349 domain-containing protein [Arthrobacter woluwensis]|uniref:DUF3349 domain-containing protein n=1 Tax=Arthrobacter woluwensis TaxID=156980 RepID=UPI001643B8CB|nr:DUF3349 domain-containing protein [Arthrobacter woluwensis]